MNYKAIKELCDTKRISLPDLSEQVGLSKTGLYKTIANSSMKVDTLERIAEVLEVPIFIFFYKQGDFAEKLLDFVSKDIETEIRKPVQDEINLLKNQVNDLINEKMLYQKELEALMREHIELQANVINHGFAFLISAGKEKKSSVVEKHKGIEAPGGEEVEP